MDKSIFQIEKAVLIAFHLQNLLTITLTMLISPGSTQFDKKLFN